MKINKKYKILFKNIFGPALLSTSIVCSTIITLTAPSETNTLKSNTSCTSKTIKSINQTNSSEDTDKKIDAKDLFFQDSGSSVNGSLYMLVDPSASVGGYNSVWKIGNNNPCSQHSSAPSDITDPTSTGVTIYFATSASALSSAGNSLIEGFDDSAFFSGFTPDASGSSSLASFMPSSLTGKFSSSSDMPALKLQLPFVIGKNAFAWAPNLTDVDLVLSPKQATDMSLGESAFYQCSNLQYFSIGSDYIKNDFKEIPTNTFYSCSNLKQIDLKQASSLKNIGDHAFAFCSSLQMIDLSDSSDLSNIGAGAFFNCSSMVQFKFPATSNVSAINIGVDILGNCTSLTSIVFPDVPIIFDEPGTEFFNCTNASNLTFNWTVEELDDMTKTIGLIDNIQTALVNLNPTEGKKVTALVPPGSVNKYKETFPNLKFSFEEQSTLPASDIFSGTLCKGNVLVTIDSQAGSVTINGYERGTFEVIDGVFKSSVTISGATYDIDAISPYAFDGCTSLSGSLSFVEGSPITSIPNSAFLDCTYLSSIYLPSTITSIGSEAFSGDESVNQIFAFWNPSTFFGSSPLVTIDNSWVDVTARASINVLIPDSDWTTDYQKYEPFKGFKFLSNNTDNANKFFKNATAGMISYYYDESSSTKEIILASASSSIVGENLELYDTYSRSGNATSYKITKINPDIFKGSAITGSFTFSKNLSAVPDNLFNSSAASFGGITSVVFPSDTNISSIGESAFAGCTNLTSVNIPNNVTEIDDNAFINCPLSAITLNDDNKSFSLIDFNNHGKAIINKTNDGKWSNLSVVVGNLAYGQVDFSNQSNQSIASDAFTDCCAISSVILSPSITSIGSQAFQSCINLQSFSATSSLKSVQSFAFAGCTNLTSISFTYLEVNNDLSFSSSWLNDVDKDNLVIHCFVGTKAMYVEDASSATPILYITGVAESNILDDIGKAEITDFFTEAVAGTITFTISGKNICITQCTVDTLNANLEFKSSVSISGINFTVSSIGDNAFANNSHIESVILPSSITSIGDGSFKNCTSLQKVTLPETSNFTTIPEEAFSGCTSLETVNFPFLYVTTIEKNAFKDDAKLNNSIIFSPYLQTIGEAAFQGIFQSTASKQVSGTITFFWGKDMLDSRNIDPTWLSDQTGASDITSDVKIYVPKGTENNYEAKRTSWGLGQATITSTDLTWSITDFFSGDDLSGTCIPTYTIDPTTQKASIRLDFVTGFTGSNITMKSTIFKEIDHVTYTFNLSSVGLGLFMDNHNVTGSFTLEDGFTSIESTAFENCGINSLNFSDSLKSIGDEAFASCSNLGQINNNPTSQFILPDTLNTIGAYAFSGTPFQTINIGSNLISIGEYAFAGCTATKDVNINWNFGGSSVIPASIADDALNFNPPSQNTNVVSPNFNIHESSLDAFLAKDEKGIPGYVRIGIGSISDPGNLIVSDADAANYIDGASGTMQVKVLGGSINYFALVDGTNIRGKGFSINENVTTIGDNCFAGNTNLSGIFSIGKFVTNIGSNAFDQCDNLTSFNLEYDSIELIQNYIVNHNINEKWLGSLNNSDVTIHVVDGMASQLRQNFTVGDTTKTYAEWLGIDKCKIEDGIVNPFASNHYIIVLALALGLGIPLLAAIIIGIASLIRRKRNSELVNQKNFLLQQQAYINSQLRAIESFGGNPADTNNYRQMLMAMQQSLNRQWDDYHSRREQWLNQKKRHKHDNIDELENKTQSKSEELTISGFVHHPNWSIVRQLRALQQFYLNLLNNERKDWTNKTNKAIAELNTYSDITNKNGLLQLEKLDYLKDTQVDQSQASKKKSTVLSDNLFAFTHHPNWSIVRQLRALQQFYLNLLNNERKDLTSKTNKVIAESNTYSNITNKNGLLQLEKLDYLKDTKVDQSQASKKKSTVLSDNLFAFTHHPNWSISRQLRALKKCCFHVLDNETKKYCHDITDTVSEFSVFKVTQDSNSKNITEKN